MKIEINELAPIEKLAYQVVAQGGRNEFGNRSLKEENLPIYLGSIKDSKIEGIDAIIITADLQGHVFENGKAKLLGEALADFLKLLLEVELPSIDSTRVGVFLCGDLYARTDKRGGLGNVTNVWRKFNEHFKFVAGVAGNHDNFGSSSAFENFKREEGIYYLDRQVKKVENIKIGGMSGIIGSPEKPFRNEETDHLNDLKKLLLKQPDFILLHEGPDHISPALQGNEKIRTLIKGSQKNTIFCGHNHWDRSVIEEENGTQIINVDAKCVILTVEKHG